MTGVDTTAGGPDPPGDGREVASAAHRGRRCSHRRRRTPATAVVGVAVTVLLVSACGHRPDVGGTRDGGEPRTQPPIGHESGTTNSTVDPGNPVRSVDWNDTTYLSACGLSKVRVTAGIGEASSVGPYYGIEVVDTDYADLDGDRSAEAVVLIDCLGADSYQPHVLVVPARGVLSGQQGARGAAVAPSSGGSLAAGQRPVAVTADAGGTIVVTVDGHGHLTQRTLHAAPGVLVGAGVA